MPPKKGAAAASASGGDSKEKKGGTSVKVNLNLKLIIFFKLILKECFKIIF